MISSADIPMHLSRNRSGMALPLVVLLVGAFLVISMNVFQNVYTEQILVGTLRDSFIAVYSADQGMERILYLDIAQGAIVTPPDYTETRELFNGACYTITVRRPGAFTSANASATYPCDAGEQAVRRRIDAVYQK
ncbi:hypothetical protein C4552_00705 [Candidatus Parcubacteria bacterium]|nr:MAG: hypothetical protein C4552_00705 [Candidatus Parcubacteria bacterium]